jgi:endonuclease/exonuclease/phosphatase family metal-dependent hydrolase
MTRLLLTGPAGQVVFGYVLVGCLVVIWLWNMAAVPLPPALPSRADTLSFATYNIWNKMFDWSLRRHCVAAAIRRSGADVVALQEVIRWADGKSQLDELMELLPEYVSHGFAGRGTVDSVGDEEGIGLLSRLPLHSLGQRDISDSQSSDVRRVILDATVCHPRLGNVTAIAVHLSYQRQSQSVNVDHIEQVGIDRNVPGSRLMYFKGS